MIIERLIGWMDNAPLEDRVKATDALVRAWQSSGLSDDQRDAAEAAMTCILDDPDIEVRQSLANALSDVSNAPRHLILALASDLPEISASILANCSALLDVELLHYIKTGNDEQQVAIASRPHLSPSVCRKIACESCREACLVLVTNSEVCPHEDDFYQMAQRFGDWKELRSCLLVRHDIGMRARVLLIEHYATTLIDIVDDLDDKAKLRQEKELRDICDKAMITFAAQISDEEIHELVQALIERKKLTTVFLLRAICMGNLSLFAHSLSVLSEQPLARVERILKDNRSNALHALYAKAGLPISALMVFCSAIASWRSHLEAEFDYPAERLPYLVTKEILANYEGKRDQIVDELLMLLRKICTETARDNARNKIDQYALEAQKVDALPAPQEVEQAEITLTPEETLAFMVEFAEELADLSLQDEEHLNEAATELVAANRDETFAEALELPEVQADIDHQMHRAA